MRKDEPAAPHDRGAPEQLEESGGTRMGSARDDDATGVHCRLGELLVERNMTLTALSAQVGISVVNLSILKNDRARAIRYSTLVAICRALDCEIGELLVRAD